MRESEGQQHMERELDERALRARTISTANTDYIKKLEADRAWRWKVKLRVTFFVVVGLGTLFATLYFSSRNAPAAAKQVVEASSFIKIGAYERALEAAREVVDLGNHQWYGHLYSSIALIHLQDYAAAEQQADLMAAYFEDRDVLPPRFLTIYLLAKKLNGKFDQVAEKIMSVKQPHYVEKAIRDVGGKSSVICYPLVTATEIESVYGPYKQSWCFRGT